MADHALNIRLDLSRHCIETAARLKAERLIREYFKRQDAGIGHRIQALNRFLAHGDFQNLRTRMGDATQAELCFSPDAGTMALRFKDQTLILYLGHSL